MISLKNRTFIVTGAAQGIGQSIATLIAELEGQVVVVDRNEDRLRSAAAALPPELVRVACGNVFDADFAATTVAMAASEFGELDGLVNNAGITRPAMIEKMEATQWQDVIDVNLTAPFYWLQAAGRHFVARSKRGVTRDASIVNISSDAGRRGTVGQVNYAAAKAGLLGITMSAAREWGRYGVRANSVCFGVVETPMTEVIRGEKFRDAMLAQIPLGRWSKPEEAATTVAFLLSSQASYVTGQLLSVNGGLHISL